MSMINCPECGKEISDKSDKCINCGFPIRGEEHTTEKENYVFCNNCNAGSKPAFFCGLLYKNFYFFLFTENDRLLQ